MWPGLSKKEQETSSANPAGRRCKIPLPPGLLSQPEAHRGAEPGHGARSSHREPAVKSLPCCAPGRPAPGSVRRPSRPGSRLAAQVASSPPPREVWARPSRRRPPSVLPKLLLPKPHSMATGRSQVAMDPLQGNWLSGRPPFSHKSQIRPQLTSPGVHATPCPALPCRPHSAARSPELCFLDMDQAPAGLPPAPSLGQQEPATPGRPPHCGRQRQQALDSPFLLPTDDHESGLLGRSSRSPQTLRSHLCRQSTPSH